MHELFSCKLNCLISWFLEKANSIIDIQKFNQNSLHLKEMTYRPFHNVPIYYCSYVLLCIGHSNEIAYPRK